MSDVQVEFNREANQLEVTVEIDPPPSRLWFMWPVATWFGLVVALNALLLGEYMSWIEGVVGVLLTASYWVLSRSHQHRWIRRSGDQALLNYRKQTEMARWRSLL